MKEANEMWSRIIFAGKDSPGQEIQKAAGQLFIKEMKMKKQGYSKPEHRHMWKAFRRKTRKEARARKRFLAKQR